MQMGTPLLRTFDMEILGIISNCLSEFSAHICARVVDAIPNPKLDKWPVFLALQSRRHNSRFKARQAAAA